MKTRLRIEATGGAYLTGESTNGEIRTMSAPILFNRRLSKSDLNSWINLLENQTDFGYFDREQATNFLKLQESLSFVSSVNDETIGGTTIYKDRTRLGMILASVAVKREFRETNAYNIIKSSLPFFRTVAIRDVEALLPDSSEEHIGFPYSLELDSWAKNVLERIGFEEKSKLFSYYITLHEDNTTRYGETMWDAQPDYEKAKKLIWELSKTDGTANSHVWSQFDFAINQDALRTVTIEGSMRLVTSIYSSEKTAIIGLLFSSESFINEGAASRMIANIIRESNVERLILPLVGKGQSNLIKAISDELEGSLRRRPMTIMRKHL